MIRNNWFKDESKSYQVDVFFFFSARNLSIAFGFNNISNFFKTLKKNTKTLYIDQRSNINGKIKFANATYKLKDLYGWCAGSKGGLLGLAKSLNLKMDEKQELDDYKNHMIDALKEKTETFIKYAFDDVKILYKIFKKKIELHNKLLKNTFNLDDEFLIEPYLFPLTNGSLVNRSFINIFMNKARTENTFEKMLLAVHKIGILNKANPLYKKNLEYYHKVFSDIPKTLKEIKNKGKRDKIENAFFNYDVFEFTAFNYSSIPYFLTFDKKTTIPLNSIVTGGRTNNERSFEYTLDYAADVDLKSCYGTALQDI